MTARKSFRLRIVKARYKPQQFKAVADLVQDIAGILGDHLEEVVVTKHPQKVIYLVKYYVNDDFPNDKIGDIIKQVELKILEIANEYFEGKRGTFAFTFKLEERNEEQPINGSGNQEVNQEPVPSQ